MKAMLLTAPGELVRDDVPRPGSEQGQLLVRVTHSGICGTDYKIFNGAIPVKYPRIMGHEMAGEVVDPGASQLRSGERVIVDPQIYCRSCFHCRIGQTHLCRNGMLIGRDRDGGFAEYVTVPPSHACMRSVRSTSSRASRSSSLASASRDSCTFSSRRPGVRRSLA